MPFSEGLKSLVRRKAHLACCICKAIGVEVHHIVPEEERGLSTLSNAAPLCPSCHETYGANPKKRKFIAEARDLWYEICHTRYASDGDRINQLIATVERCPTAEDLRSATRGVIHDLKVAIRESQTFRVRESAGRMRTTPDLSLDEVITHFYSSKGVVRNVSDLESRFFFAFVAGTRLNKEDSRIRNEFMTRFGQETAKRVCRYASSHFDLDVRKWISEEAISPVINLALTAMLFVLGHKEVGFLPYTLRIRVRQDGQLIARVGSRIKKKARKTHPTRRCSRRITLADAAIVHVRKAKAEDKAPRKRARG